MFVLFIIILVVIVRGNMAPDEAPDLPSDWCKGGHPTRTTGECICVTGECEGPHCVRSGLVFYKYTDCPTCKCVKPGTPKKDPTPPREGVVPPPPKNNRPPPTGDDPHSAHQFGTHATAEALGDEHMSYEEWLEENWRYLFAVFASVLFVIVMGAYVYTKMNGQVQSEDYSNEGKSN